jgi:uncharacterized protein YxeA
MKKIISILFILYFFIYCVNADGYNKYALDKHNCWVMADRDCKKTDSVSVRYYEDTHYCGWNCLPHRTTPTTTTTTTMYKNKFFAIDRINIRKYKEFRYRIIFKEFGEMYLKEF